MRTVPPLSGIIALCLPLLAGTLVGQEPDQKAPAPLDILVIAPHPDDEAIGCAGVMLRALEKKQRVGVVLVTSGDAHRQAAAAVAKKPEARLEAADFLRLARIRQQHSVGALSKIGVRKEDLIALGYPDSGLKAIYESKDEAPYRQPLTGKAETYAVVIRDYHTLAHGRPAPYTRAAVLADLVEILKARKPKEIYVTGEADTHPDHRATFWFVRDAAKTAGYRGSLLTFVVHGKPPAGPAHRVALTEAEQGRKRAIITEYQAKLSPVHDYLAETFTREEELFWPVRIETPAEDQPKPIGPAEAARRVNEEVTLRMEVKSAALREGVCFLNSEENFKDAKNFTVFIDKEALARFKQGKIENPAAHFKGQTIQVKGKVTLYRGRPEIKVSGPDAIKVVEQK